MNLLDSLKFVLAAVAKKDFVPALVHFRIKGGMVKAFNGSLAICCPINLDLDCAPNAAQFIAALQACDDSPTLRLTPNGKLAIRSGNFIAHIDCDASDKFPDINPEGDHIKLTYDMIPALRDLEPFVATDASRPWACGILFANQSAFATNNIALVQYWLGYEFPRPVNIPAAAISELVRIGDKPIRIQISQYRITFHFEDGRWLSTSLIEAPWPQTLNDLLNKKLHGMYLASFPDGFFDSLQKLAPFCGELNRVFFHGDHISTIGTTDSADGNQVLQECPKEGCYNAKYLLQLRKIANAVGFSAWPHSIPFQGPRVRGIIAGIRVQ